MPNELDEVTLRFASELATYDPSFAGLGAVPETPEDARSLIDRWMRAKHGLLCPLLCLSKGKPKVSIQTAGVSGMTALILLLKNKFGVDFPAESAANFLVLYGLETFCNNCFPAKP